MPTFPKRALVAIATTAVALALMFSFKTPDTTITHAPGAAIASPAGQGLGATPRPTPRGGGSGSGSSPQAGGTGGTGSGSGAAADGTLTGVLVRTRFGDVQVQVTVKNGKISDVLAIQLPTHGRSGAISQAVAPMLHDEALQAQSAQIDIVSGATYTSEAYAQSLQSALDQAHS